MRHTLGSAANASLRVSSLPSLAHIARTKIAGSLLGARPALRARVIALAALLLIVLPTLIAMRTMDVDHSD